MKLIIKLGNLFSCDEKYSLAHCISSDFVLGKGIALQFSKIFNSRNFLNSHYKERKGIYPNCIRQKIIGRSVYHLVTKNKYYMKPTYDSLKDSLIKMRELAILNNELNIAMPKIGCGLDLLDWQKVKDIINEVFEDTNIEIVVYTGSVE